MLLVIEKSSIQAFLVSEEKGMQQRRVPHCSPEVHQDPISQVSASHGRNCTHTETVQCDLQDFVFANCPGKAVFGLADSQRASKTISSLKKLPKAAEPMIKDL